MVQDFVDCRGVAGGFLEQPHDASRWIVVAGCGATFRCCANADPQVIKQGRILQDEPLGHVGGLLADVAAALRLKQFLPEEVCSARAADDRRIPARLGGDLHLGVQGFHLRNEQGFADLPRFQVGAQLADAIPDTDHLQRLHVLALLDGDGAINGAGDGGPLIVFEAVEGDAGVGLVCRLASADFLGALCWLFGGEVGVVGEDFGGNVFPLRERLLYPLFMDGKQLVVVFAC